jgi:hypothetical protein
MLVAAFPIRAIEAAVERIQASGKSTIEEDSGTRSAVWGICSPQIKSNLHKIRLLRRFAVKRTKQVAPKPCQATPLTSQEALLCRASASGGIVSGRVSSGTAIVRYSNYDIPLFMPGVYIPVRFDHVFQRIASINNRSYEIRFCQILK